MGKGSNKRALSVLLCLLMVIGLVAPLSTEKAEAASVTISKNGSVSQSVSYGKTTINVTLKDAYTGLQVYKDSWITYTKSGSTYVVTVAANTGNSQRKGSILFKETRNGVVSTWELKITQAGKPKPTNTPKPTATPTKNEYADAYQETGDAYSDEKTEHSYTHEKASDADTETGYTYSDEEASDADTETGDAYSYQKTGNADPDPEDDCGHDELDFWLRC